MTFASSVTYSRSRINIHQLENEALQICHLWLILEDRFKIRDPPVTARISTFPLWNLTGKMVECPFKPCTKKFFHPPNGNIALNSNTKLCTVVLGKTWVGVCVRDQTLEMPSGRWAAVCEPRTMMQDDWLTRLTQVSSWNILSNDSYE